MTHTPEPIHAFETWWSNRCLESWLSYPDATPENMRPTWGAGGKMIASSAWVAATKDAEQQNSELKEQSSRLANESVRQAQQNADLCVKNAELLNIIKWANNHGGLGYSIHGEFEKAIAKAGDKT